MTKSALARWFFRRNQTSGPAGTGRAASEHEPFAAAQRLIDAGNTLEDRGDAAGSLACYREAVALAPAYPRAHLNLGNALERQGEIDAAIHAFQAALGLDSMYAPAHFNLGNLYARAGNFPAAESALRGARRTAPRMADAAIALANLLESVGRMREAEDQLRDALSISPGNPGATHNLGLLLSKLGRWDDAEEVLQQGVAIAPTSARALAALAYHHQQTGRLEEADRLYRRALAADPQYREAYTGLLFTLNLRDDLSALQIFGEHENFGAAFEVLTSTDRETSDVSSHTQARIKVAYLSGDLMRHPVGMFLRPIIKHHQRSQFEVFCYSNNEVDDEMTGELRSYADKWRDIAGRDDATVAQMLRSDGIGIVVDLSGHTARSRTLLFARRCAPVQATWLGYLNTTGLKSADYHICDSYTDPVGKTEHLYSERLFRLPHSQWCYSPVYDVPVDPIPHADEPERVIFGSFNQFPKITVSCLDLWCEILRSVANSELQVFSVPEGRTTTAFLDSFVRRGIDRRRVTLHRRVDIVQYLKAMGTIDIALDTFPYNGATTTLDALWMGAPLVALVGDRSMARGSFSILNALDMPELIARTTTEFVDRNIELARASEWRRELRRTLRARMQGSPLMDAAAFTRDLEEGYRQMWAAARSL